MILAGAASVPGLILTLPFVLLALPFWFVRGVTRFATRLVRRAQPDETAWGELIRYEPEVGWMPRANLDVHARAGGLFHLTTDEEGWRGKLPLDEADLVVMGDSFAFGQGADDGDLFTEFVPGARAKSVGANGYNLVQSHLWMQRLAPRLRGRTVAWLIYYDNDLLENLVPYQQHYRMPFVRETEDEDGWEIVTSHVSPEPWPFRESRDYTTRLAEICSPTRLSRRAFGAAEFLLQKAREACGRAEARLVVVGIPSPELVRPRERERLASLLPNPRSFDARLPDRRLAEICESLGLPFVALAEHLGSADYLPDDCHWTPGGHRKVGALLGDLYEEAKRLPVPGRAGAAAGPAESSVPSRVSAS